MGLFCATAWMIKGGSSGGGATITDGKPSFTDYTKVSYDYSDATLTISNNNSSFILEWKENSSGFEKYATLDLYIMYKNGGWEHTSSLGQIPANPGKKHTLNISEKVTGNSDLKNDLTKASEVYAYLKSEKDKKYFDHISFKVIKK